MLERAPGVEDYLPLRPAQLSTEPVMYYSLDAASLLADTPPEGAQQLIILLHGVGAPPDDLLSMARAFHTAWPQAAIALPPGLFPFDGGGNGRQWFSISGITEANRPERIAAVMLKFLALIRQIQTESQVPPADTVIAGFSQGAIMALEAVKAVDGLAGRVLSFSGRYAELPTEAPQHTSISFYHGDQDDVISVDHAREAFEHLQALGGDVSLDIAHGVGHEAHPALVAQAIDRLRDVLPARLWRRALSGGI